MSKPVVYIRVDGSDQIGLGHIYRSIALAQMIEEEFDVRFYSIEIPEGVTKNLKESYNYELINISYEDEFFKDIRNQAEPRVVVLDGYYFETKYQSTLKELGASVVCIDDIHDTHFVADAVINHAPGITQEHYSVEDYTNLYLGPDYALLREEFIVLTSKNNFRNKLETAFVCFGGSDPQDFTSKTIRALAEREEVKETIVVTGAGFKRPETIETEFTDCPMNIAHYHNIGDHLMTTLMERSDFAIVPSSTVLYEILAAGLPTITGYFVENQTRIYEGFLQTGAVAGVGELSEDSIRKGIANLTIEKCLDMQLKQKSVIDGRSPIRILGIFKKLLS